MMSGNEFHDFVLMDEITYTPHGIIIHDYLVERYIRIAVRSVDCNTAVCIEKQNASFTSDQCRAAIGWVCDYTKWAGKYSRVASYVCKGGVAIGCNWMTRQQCLRYQNMPICVA